MSADILTTFPFASASVGCADVLFVYTEYVCTVRIQHAFPEEEDHYLSLFS